MALAIGNAPWPIGATMVGIHERSAREKLFAHKISHVLDNEEQKSYIQSVKRIISFAERRSAKNTSRMFDELLHLFHSQSGI